MLGETHKVETEKSGKWHFAGVSRFSLQGQLHYTTFPCTTLARSARAVTDMPEAPLALPLTSISSQ